MTHCHEVLLLNLAHTNITKKLTPLLSQNMEYFTFKIPHTGDIASLDLWVDQEYPKPIFFVEKIIQNTKTQKSLKICQN